MLIDARCEPPKNGAYAAGDVTGRDQFVYMAADGAKLAAKNALNGQDLDRAALAPEATPTLT